jgi:esterase/lipase superfamily enzyme
MTKESSTWRSERLGNKEVKVVRWGESGTPVLVFPTAAGDCEEAERFKLMHVMAPFLQEGRIKIYSVDSVAGRRGSIRTCRVIKPRARRISSTRSSTTRSCPRSASIAATTTSR